MAIKKFKFSCILKPNIGLNDPGPLSSRPITDDEFRLLGKGLKLCPKPKPHNVIKLATETFKFSRRIRLKEFFAPEQEDEETSDSNSETEEIPTVKKSNSCLLCLLQDVTAALIFILRLSLMKFYRTQRSIAITVI